MRVFLMASGKLARSKASWQIDDVYFYLQSLWIVRIVNADHDAGLCADACSAAADARFEFSCYLDHALDLSQGTHAAKSLARSPRLLPPHARSNLQCSLDEISTPISPGFKPPLLRVTREVKDN